jgi:serine/threonine protein kinase
VFVDFFGWFKDGSDMFLAMEYVPLGDLEKNVLGHSGKIPEVEARDIAEQILSGLKLMHAESFAHRDLKPQVFHYNRGQILASNANIIIL